MTKRWMAKLATKVMGIPCEPSDMPSLWMLVLGLIVFLVTLFSWFGIGWWLLNG